MKKDIIYDGEAFEKNRKVILQDIGRKLKSIMFKKEDLI